MSNLITSQELTKEQIDLIKATVAKGATNDELKLFLYRAKEMGLDPLKTGQIYFVKYGNSPGTIIVGLDGFRARASNTNKHTGTKRGLIFEEGKLIGAWCEVYRSDWTHPAREEVMLSEYNTGKAMWAKMPSTMIKKVAEVAALRMAFPDQLGGLYSQEEMDQASHKVVAPHNYNPDPKTQTLLDVANKPEESLPEQEDIDKACDYVVRDGRLRGQALKDLDPWEIHSSLEGRKKMAGIPSQETEEFIFFAEQYLSEIQYTPPEKHKGTRVKKPVPINEPPFDDAPIFEGFPKDEK